MVSENHVAPRVGKMPVFAISCWVLALVAFSQILIGAVALSKKFEQSQQVRYIEKEVPKTVVIRVPAAAPAAAPSPVVTRPPAAAPVAETVRPAVAPTPVSTPRIDDPRSERLVAEARQARVAGDMGLAIVKLEEAQSQSPEDANVHYELGLVHEQMGVFDVAASHYQKVFSLGVSGAGSLYELAATKLRDGFEKPNAMLGKLSLGPIVRFPDPNYEEGQRVILTIPVQKAPAEEIDVNELEISVLFFNKTSKGEIIQLEDKSWVKNDWVSLPFDWARGEESLRSTYIIPNQDAATEHLFGDRTYFGQVVSLTYKGEVLDVQAWPPALAARIGQQPAGNPNGQFQPDFQGTLPPDFDPNLPLLPPLQEQSLNPPLPQK